MNKIERIFGYFRFLLIRLGSRGALKTRGRNYFSKGSFDLNNGTIHLGELNVFDDNFDLEIKGTLSIGSRNYFNKFVKIICLERIEIGNDCIIADSVHFYDHDHNYADTTRLISKQGYKIGAIKIGNNVWIGAKATILKGVSIGDGAVVGANALVTKDIPANGVAVGNPAQIIKMRGHA